MTTLGWILIIVGAVIAAIAFTTWILAKQFTDLLMDWLKKLFQR